MNLKKRADSGEENREFHRLISTWESIFLWDRPNPTYFPRNLKTPAGPSSNYNDMWGTLLLDAKLIA
jgi:hypothetical protein